MTWVLGIIFCLLVAIFCWNLFRNSLRIREALIRVSKRNRIAAGTALFLASFLSATLAIMVGPPPPWTPESFDMTNGLVLTILMFGFVVLQTLGAVTLISLVFPVAGAEPRVKNPEE